MAHFDLSDYNAWSFFVVVTVLVCCFFINRRPDGVCVVGLGETLRYWHLRKEMALDSSASQNNNNNNS